ncbi:MAG: hypothetical protein WD767_01560 [Alphaproteobacteria bacterium]
MSGQTTSKSKVSGSERRDASTKLPAHLLSVPEQAVFSRIDDSTNMDRARVRRR